MIHKKKTDEYGAEIKASNAVCSPGEILRPSMSTYTRVKFQNVMRFIETVKDQFGKLFSFSSISSISFYAINKVGWV